MKRIFFILLVVASVISATAQKRKVELNFVQLEGVYVVVNEVLIGENPKYLKLDFNLGGDIIIFKRGYYSQRIEIDPETVFARLKVDLEKKPKSAAAKIKRLLQPDTLVISEIITNMDEHDVREVVDGEFIANNYFIGKDVALFPQAVNELENSRYKIAVEIVKTNQVKSVYSNPRFMMAFAKIRWSLLDTKTNKVVFFKETEGHYFVRIQSTKGMQVTKQMTKVMKEAIKEAQFKLLTDKEFIDLVMKD